MKNLNLTPRAQKLIKEALKICVEHKNATITITHIFAAFLSIKNNQIEEAFLNFNIDIDKLNKITIEYIKNSFSIIKKTNHKPILSDNSKLLFQYAKELSRKYDHKYIGLEHIFISLFEVKSDLFNNFIETIREEFELDLIIHFFENRLEEDELSIVKAQSFKSTESNNQTANFDPKKYKTLNTYASN